MLEPEQVRHWSGSGPVQVEQVGWQATHSADDVERYNQGMETNQSMWDQNGIKWNQNGFNGTIDTLPVISHFSNTGACKMYRRAAS